MQLTNEELKNINVLLQRVDLKGNEAIPVAQLQLKIQKLIQEGEVISTPTITGNPPAMSEPTATNESKE